MKIEKLETSNNKFKYIVVGVIIAASIYTLINILPSKASYRNTESIPLMSGTITYKVPDINAIAMFVDGELTDTMPGAGYEIDTENSYCYTTSPNTHDDVTLATDSDGNLVIGKLKKGSKCYLYFVEKKMTAEQALTKLGQVSGLNYTVKEETTFSGTNSDTTQDLKGVKVVYKLQDNDGETYVFRGNPDNWVTFANKKWRIIRINGDGTLRLLYYCDSVDCSSSENALESIKYNSSSANNTYVGFYYGSETGDYNTTHSNATANDIVTELKTWYQTNLETNYKDYLSETTGWCNDRTVSKADSSYTGNGTGTSKTSYAPRERFYNKTTITPKLTCNDNDWYTIPNSGNVGNQAMKLKTISGNYVPIGLITADEAAIGGLLYGLSNTNKTSYVSAGSSSYWTMSSSYFNGSSAYMFYVDSGGYLSSSYGYVNRTYGVRPVINVNIDKVKNITGKGTSDERFATT